jgi:hypothetical protein
MLWESKEFRLSTYVTMQRTFLYQEPSISLFYIAENNENYTRWSTKSTTYMNLP